VAQDKEKRAAYMVAYREANRDKEKARSAAWYVANVEKAKANSSSWYKANADKVKAASAARYAADVDKARAYAAAYREANVDKLKCSRLQRDLGITLAERDQMIEDQQGLCLICARGFENLLSRHIHVDHCHENGKVRGVLCQYCNIGIGNFRDDPSMLRAAADYLERDYRLEAASSLD